LVELPLGSILQDLTAFRSLLQRNRTRNAIVRVNPKRGKAVKIAVTLRKLKLSLDGLALALFFR
jgi:hypothetical protein